MARQTLKQILSTSLDDFLKLGRADLRKATQTLIDAANKRIKRGSGPLVERAKSEGGFTTKGKNLMQLRQEYKRVKSFLESPLSTKRGVTAFKKKTIESLRKKGVNITLSNFDSLWRAYEELRSMSPDIANLDMKYDVFDVISEYINQGDNIAETVMKTYDRLTEIYESTVKSDDFFSKFL